jgi:uncharacterized protein YkwD
VTGSHRRRASGRAVAAAVLIAGVLATAGFGAVLRGQLPDARPGDRAVAEPIGSSTATPPGTATPAGTPSAGPSTTTAAPAPSRSRSRIEIMEDEVLAMVNRERQRDGCTTAVHADDRLHDAARGHSVDMAAHRTMSHTGSDGSTPWQRAERAGYPSAMAENVAYGYPTAAAVMAGWMGSPGHKRNILNCSAKALGVGLAYTRDNTPYWTQLFGRT